MISQHIRAAADSCVKSCCVTWLMATFEGAVLGRGALGLTWVPPLVILQSLMHSPPLLAGASGGAVIDAAGQLLGLVTSNTKHTATGHSLARLNYSLPATALRPLWNLLRSSPTADSEAIRQLDADSPALRRVWALSSGLSPDTGSDGGTERLQRLLKEKSIEMAGYAQ